MYYTTPGLHRWVTFREHLPRGWFKLLTVLSFLDKSVSRCHSSKMLSLVRFIAILANWLLPTVHTNPGGIYMPQAKAWRVFTCFSSIATEKLLFFLQIIVERRQSVFSSLFSCGKRNLSWLVPDLYREQTNNPSCMIGSHTQQSSSR